MKKHLFTLFLAIVASVGFLSAQITVRLDPRSCETWKTVYLWAWTDSGNIFASSWPGQVIGKDAGGWYSYTFSSVINSVNIIWTNGTDQTIDITNVTTSTCYELNSKTGTDITVTVASYESVKIEDLYYNLYEEDQTATVTGWSYSSSTDEYSGDVVIPSSFMYNSKTYTVTRIGDDAFNKCYGLTSVTIGEGVTSIGSWAFYGCSGLTSITIPNSVTSIGNYAFQNCSELTSVTIGNSVTSIGNGAFYDCNGLTSVTIGNSVTSIGNVVFYGCSKLTSITLNSNAIVSKTYTSSSNISNIFGSQVTEYIIGDSVISIGNYAFYNFSGLTSVTIGNSVTSIGSSAFWGCSGLTSITIPNSVTSIGSYAFSNCSNLTSVTLNSNAIVGKTYTSSSNISNIFGSQVTEYIIGDSVTSIGDYAFYNCSGLTSITIPNSVTSIGTDAFSGYSGLTQVNISDLSAWCKIEFSNTESNPLYYVHHLYLNGEEITNLVIPNDVTSIGNYAFYYCSGLTSITIPNSVTSIGSNAFTGCTALSKLYITNLANWCGMSFTNTDTPLQYADLYIDGEQPKSITIPNGVSKIDSYTFTKCKQLNEVIIPSSVTEIGENAFSNSNRLTKITLGEGIETIGSGAFKNCPYLLTINAQMEFPPVIDASVFADCGDLSGIDCYVPQNSLAYYKKTAVWKEFNLLVGQKLFVITILSNNTAGGYVSGTGAYAAGVEVPLTATANTGYHFLCWNDGNKEPNRTITVTADATYTALFAANEPTEEEQVSVTTQQTSATVTAELIEDDNVDSYRLVIYYQSATFCTLMLDKEGHLLSIDFANSVANAPQRRNMPAQAQIEAGGLNIPITGLQSGTTYQFTLDALDEEGNILDRREGEFTTAGVATGLDDISTTATPTAAQKVILNGNLYILTPDGTIFNAQGARVK